MCLGINFLLVTNQSLQAMFAFMNIERHRHSKDTFKKGIPPFAQVDFIHFIFLSSQTPSNALLHSFYVADKSNKNSVGKKLTIFLAEDRSLIREVLSFILKKIPIFK
jgi:hypothetical protein